MKREVYTLEFRAEAVKLVLEQGLSRSEAALRLSMPKATLANWVKAATHSESPIIPGSRSSKELEVENARLRKELTQARMERDILKKAAAYYAMESLPGTR